MKRGKLDTEAIGLDAGLGLIRWLTGAENLHYGLWTGLDVRAENVGAAQAAFTDKLFSFLPEGKLRILDIGGGAGETAAKLIALGHTVDIIVPSALLAERCRANAPDATVHEMKFEDFHSDIAFDLCLFSESFQYIPLDVALDKSIGHLKPGGHILIADCFRSDSFSANSKTRVVGGGHPVQRFYSAVSDRSLAKLDELDITTAVAPSIDIEQSFFNLIGDAVSLVDAELARKRPKSRWVIAKVLGMLVGKRRRLRLDTRLRENERTSAVFELNNRYLMVLLQKT